MSYCVACRRKFVTPQAFWYCCACAPGNPKAGATLPDTDQAPVARWSIGMVLTAKGRSAIEKA